MEGEVWNGREPTIRGKEVETLEELLRRSTSPIWRRTQVIDCGAGGRD